VARRRAFLNVILGSIGFAKADLSKRYEVSLSLGRAWTFLLCPIEYQRFDNAPLA